ncbi:substrate-binding periplasmic protein [Paraglaciecola sp.]|uniref:substrate-binding periplasmic protein n=1 Tax=Paraglaciecola sp. TaxID=1920173 RepID=UPI003EF9ACFC
MRVLLALLLCVNVCSAKEYHFVSIQNLVEQEVGRLVLPQIYRKLGIDITITPLPGKRAQAHATSGKSDGEIMRIYNYGIENPTTLRVPTPYYSLETMAFVKVGNGVRISNKEDLSRFRLGKVRGVKHTNYITQGLDNVTDHDSTEQIMRLVDRGMLDVALTNTTDGLMALKMLSISTVKPMEKPLRKLALYHYIHEDHKALIPLLDAMIKEMTQTGELALITRAVEKEILQIQH